MFIHFKKMLHVTWPVNKISKFWKDLSVSYAYTVKMSFMKKTYLEYELSLDLDVD